MTIRVTITKAGRSDTYGRPLVVGTTYTLEDAYGRDLITSGFGTDTDSAIGNTMGTSFIPYNIVISTSPPLNSDGRPDNTIYLMVSV